MRYLFINSVYGVRSTGKLIADKCHELVSKGNTCAVAYGRETVPDDSVTEIQIGSRLDYSAHAVMTRLFDAHGLGSRRATMRLVTEIEEWKPDVIWMHNLHGYYINYELLFAWIKKHPKIKYYWTLHDCWAFTGHCAYFTMAGCSKWVDGCQHCGQFGAYPKSLLMDSSENNYARKKKAFCGVSNLTLIVPSKWLAELIGKSFLNKYPIEIINNKIDTSVFKPTESDFKAAHGLKNKKIVLGVAVGWEETKGYHDMLALREKLPHDYEIVLVGVTEKQIMNLPDGITGIQRTANQTELAAIYTAANVFVNPTHQDNYPTVNLEASACGTPVVTYNVGGSPESAEPENVIKENDINALAERIMSICTEDDNVL